LNRTALVERAASRAVADRRAVFAHPFEAIKRGWVITLDEKPPEGVPAIRPLPAKEYIEAITELWMQSPKGLLGKSRQPLVSWVFAWLELWDALAIPRMSVENDKMESFANGSTIEAIPEGAAIVRGKVPSSMFMDEIAFHETAEDNWNAAVPSAKKLWGVSTPNGHEFMYRQGDRGRPWDKWREWPEAMRGLYGYVNKDDIQLAFLHYTADEDRCTVEWQTDAAKGYTNSRDRLRELEGDFSLAAGIGVYANDFSRSRHVISSYEPDPQSPIYRGWDFGYNGQAVGWYQFNHNGQLVWFDQVILKAVALPRVIQEVKSRTLRWLQGGQHAADDNKHHLGITMLKPDAQVYDYGDPSGESHNTRGQTDAALMSQHGMMLRSKPTSGRKRDLVEQGRKLLLPRSDGKPGLLIAENVEEMDDVVAGFGGGYHYDKPKEGKAEKEIPAKDGLYDHIFDQYQYVVDNISPIRFGSYETEPDPDWWRDMEPGVGQDG
jgi:hypothetical protein